MKLLAFLFFLLLGLGWQNVAEINSRSRQAQTAYQNGNYAAAVRHFEYLVLEAEITDFRTQLNLAHAYRKNNQLDKARKTYEKCVKSPEAALRSQAWEQLGTLQALVQQYQPALTFYKRALVADPGNEQARYNYEMLKKHLRQHPEEQKQLPPPAPETPEKQEKPQPKPEDQQQQNETPDPNGNQEKDNPNQPEKGDQQQKPDNQANPESNEKKPQQQAKPNTGQQKETPQGTEQGETKGENLAQNDEKQQPDKPTGKGSRAAADDADRRLQTQYERLRKAYITPEKAEMMLDAMRQAEQQYIQQLPKKATQKRAPNKPDW